MERGFWVDGWAIGQFGPDCHEWFGDHGFIGGAVEVGGATGINGFDGDGGIQKFGFDGLLCAGCAVDNFGSPRFAKVGTAGGGPCVGACRRGVRLERPACSTSPR